VEALAVCHNVNVSREDGDADKLVYQASSPDEVALVKFAAGVGCELVGRTLSDNTVRTVGGGEAVYKVLHVFPFTSETKRMGIIVRCPGDKIALYMKGSDATMSSIVQVKLPLLLNVLHRLCAGRTRLFNWCPEY